VARCRGRHLRRAVLFLQQDRRAQLGGEGPHSNQEQLLARDSGVPREGLCPALLHFGRKQLAAQRAGRSWRGGFCLLPHLCWRWLCMTETRPLAAGTPDRFGLAEV
jgi:hypothetical protein